jgi:hypothetical protein
MIVNRLLFLVLAIPLLLGSCTDKCEKTQIVRRTRSITLSATEIRGQIKSVAPIPLEQPGKIYLKDHFLYINEIQKGIHVFDNSNPSNPRQVSFISIPGNGDLAIKGDILYADSYMDLVAIDISNPQQVLELSRHEASFTDGIFQGMGWSYNPSTGSVQTQEAYFLEETFETNCEGVIPRRGGWFWDLPYYGFAYLNQALNSGGSYSGSAAQAESGGAGTGGSMARFTLYDNYLYTIDQRKLHLFDVSNPTNPTFVKDLELGWGIETIFPYKTNLFIGTTTGMQILDNTNPADPTPLSTFTHARACDPVVVHNDIAYVTLRTGAACGGTQNRLELVDVSDLRRPSLIKSYEMQNPAGLSINYPTLYLCEGEHGLKVFDVSEKFAVDKNLLAHRKGMEAYDVIAMDKNIMMIGKDGLYQFNATDPKNMTQLSHIPVQTPAVVVENLK